MRGEWKPMPVVLGQPRSGDSPWSDKSGEMAFGDQELEPMTGKASKSRADRRTVELDVENLQVNGTGSQNAKLDVSATCPQAEGSPKGMARASPTSAVSGSGIILLICGHAISASALLVVNKWALQSFRYVWLLTTLQFLPAALLVAVVGALGIAEVDALRWRKLVAFFPAAGMFFITMTAGNSVVKHSNVDTFIVMRSLVPIPCALLESIVLGEPWPRPVSWIGLAVLLLGALGYANANRGISVKSYSWMILFLIMMPVDAVLIKHLINSAGLSPWGLVYYQNLLAGVLGILCTCFFELSSGQAVNDAMDALLTPGSDRAIGAWLPVALSAVLGIFVSFFQMSVRKVISSTAFMVLGVSNKLLAMLINQLALEANSGLASIMSVLLSIAGALGFQQTVKGKGISQAANNPNTKGIGIVQAYIGVLVGVSWAAYLFKYHG